MALAGGLEERSDAAEGDLADLGGDDLRLVEMWDKVFLDDFWSDEARSTAKHVGMLIAGSKVRIDSEKWTNR